MVHGKRWTYVKEKCRCAECTAANETYMVAYRAKNKAKILAREVERYAEQKERIIARQTAYYQREKDAVRMRAKRPSALRRKADNQATRRAREVGQFVEVVLRRVVYQHRGARCGICGERVSRRRFQIDHIYPLSRGGPHGYFNCQPAHAKCNLRKGAKV